MVVNGRDDMHVKFMNVRANIAKEYTGRGGAPGDKYFRTIHNSLFCPFFLKSIITDLLSLLQVKPRELLYYIVPLFIVLLY